MDGFRSGADPFHHTVSLVQGFNYLLHVTKVCSLRPRCAPYRNRFCFPCSCCLASLATPTWSLNANNINNRYNRCMHRDVPYQLPFFSTAVDELSPISWLICLSLSLPSAPPAKRVSFTRGFLLNDQQRDVVIVFWAQCFHQIGAGAREFDLVSTSIAIAGQEVASPIRKTIDPKRQNHASPKIQHLSDESLV